MREYMIGIFTLSLVIGACSYFSYSDSKFEKFGYGILMLYTAALPLLSLLSGASEGVLPQIPEFSEGEYSEDYKDVAREAFEEGIAAAVCDKFSLKEGEVHVVASGFDFEKMRADKIKVVLSGAAAFADFHRIEDYINNMERGECEAEIEVG